MVQNYSIPKDGKNKSFRSRYYQLSEKLLFFHAEDKCTLHEQGVLSESQEGQFFCNVNFRNHKFTQNAQFSAI